jgi:N-methylhydantoinase B
VANGSAMPVEIIETEFPVEVERFELIPDPGGAGRYRGGLAYVRQYRMLADAVFATHGGKRLRPTAGREDGWPGRLARVLVNPGTPGERQAAGSDAISGWRGAMFSASSSPAPTDTGPASPAGRGRPVRCAGRVRDPGSGHGQLRLRIEP